MSSDGRKDFGQKVKETITPDAMKSDTTKLKEAGTDTLDRGVREFQPDSTKSNTQEAFDKAERSKDNAKHGSTHESVGDKIKDALGMPGHGKDHQHNSTHTTHEPHNTQSI